MTSSEVLQYAAWPACPIRLPTTLSLGPHGTIIDVPMYISIQVTRAHGDNDTLRSLHAPQLAWVAREVEKFNQ